MSAECCTAVRPSVHTDIALVGVALRKEVDCQKMGELTLGPAGARQAFCSLSMT